MTDSSEADQISRQDLETISEALRYAADEEGDVDKAIEKISEVTARETGADVYYNTNKDQLIHIAKLAYETHKLPLVIVVYVKQGQGDFRVRLLSDLSEVERKSLDFNITHPLEDCHNIIVKCDTNVWCKRHILRE